MRYEIEFDADAEAELMALRPFDREAILDAIETSLRYEPMKVSRNRKPVLPTELTVDFGITWELRVGVFRVLL